MIDELKSLGLSERECNSYLALYNFQEATATKLAKVTKEFRTNIYDTLNSLVKKGLVTYNIKNSVTYYRILDPKKLIDFVKEREKTAESILPELEKKFISIKEKPTVEIYEGREGFKSLLLKAIREEKTIYIIGASEEWVKQFPIPLQQYMKEREKKRIKARILYFKGTETINHKLNKIRFLPTQFQQPSTISIFGDYVAIIMWSEPLTATLTKSIQLSNSFKKYFEILWNTAKS